MTKKRFSFDKSRPLKVIPPIMDNGVDVRLEELVELLNGLHKENQQLKQELLETIEHYSSERPNNKGFIGNGRFG